MFKDAKYRKRSARIVSAVVHDDFARCDIVGTDDQGRIWEITRNSSPTKKAEKKEAEAKKEVVRLYRFLEKNGGPACMENLEKAGYDLSVIGATAQCYSGGEIQMMKVFAQENGYLRSLPLMMSYLPCYGNSPVTVKVSIGDVFLSVGNLERRPADRGFAMRGNQIADVSYRPDGEIFVYNVREMKTRRYRMMDSKPIRENVKKEVEQQLMDHEEILDDQDIDDDRYYSFFLEFHDFLNDDYRFLDDDHYDDDDQIWRYPQIGL